jgi:hypothetical protein
MPRVLRVNQNIAFTVIALYIFTPVYPGIISAGKI